MKIYKLTDDLPTNRPKKILIFTGEKNLISLARSNKVAYERYKELLRQDYILYHFDKGVSKLYQRKYVNELWVSKDLSKYNDVYYTIQSPEGRKLNTEIGKRLLVLFPCMAGLKHYDSHLIRARMFVPFFKEIERSLVKNVYIMRIMDLNCSHGSHYVNTINYPAMEDDIQSAIESVIQELGVARDQVVLYGASKGGTGAILHGARADLKALAVDPILSLAYYNQGDYHFLKDLREIDLTPRLNEYLSNNLNKKYLISSPNVKFNYEQTQKINAYDCLKRVELKDNHITKHEHVSQNSVPEQLMILNSLFTDLL